MGDVSAAAEAHYRELLRAMAPERQLETAMKLSLVVRELALAGIRELFPEASSNCGCG